MRKIVIMLFRSVFRKKFFFFRGLLSRILVVLFFMVDFIDSVLSGRIMRGRGILFRLKMSEFKRFVGL